MKILENLCLGLDVGIGSVGWCAVYYAEGDTDPFACTGLEIHKKPSLGVRIFDVPENPKTKELLNKHRQTIRRQRITIKRRAQRMRRIKRLLRLHGMPCAPAALHGVSPWELRMQALDRKLEHHELAAVLVHMAKHRGFKSNSKTDKASPASSDTGKMLQAVGALQKAVQNSGCRTVGEYMAGHVRKRNRSGIDGKPVYENTMLRSLLEEETRLICSRQTELGNDRFSQELLEEYLKLAFEQRPLRSWEDMVGRCVFEEAEKRAPALSFTAERFRLAQRLANLRLRLPGGVVERIPPEQVRTVVEQTGQWKGLTYTRLKKLIKQENASFEGLNYGRRDKKGQAVDPEKRDVCGVSAGCAQGSYILAKVLGEELFLDMAQRRTENNRILLDEIANVLTMHDDVERIEDLLQELPLNEQELHTLLQALRAGEFAAFRRFFKLSFKAMENILPLMIDAGSYDLGCEMAGYNHAKARKLDLGAIRNPVVLRMLREVRKQFSTIVREHGALPGKVHVELLRDVGKSVDERNEIERGLDRRREEREKNRADFAALAGKNPEQVSRTELLRYELWREQAERCAYYHLWKDHGGAAAYASNHGMIAVNELLDGPNAAQIDHILPRSRTFDNRFINLCLVRVEANQAKGNRTPWEWIGRDHPGAWHVYEQWVRSLRIKGFKKRNCLLKNLDEDMENRFHERNRHDTSYAARLIMRWIEDEYERLGATMEREDGTRIRRVFARPGKITSDLRKAWGVEGLKKDASGARLGDKNHALDALLVALCSESTLQSLTKAYKRMEHWQDKYRLVPDIPPPWPEFRQDVKKALASVFVSRAERGKERGRLHEDTLRQMRLETDEQGREVRMLYERKPVASLSLADLDRLKDAKRNAWLRDILEDWIARKKPKDDPPRSPKGDVIRRVRLRRGPYSSGILVPRGQGQAQADNAAIVRTDVFRRDGKYYLVPVYASQLAAAEPPNLAIMQGKEEKDWLPMDEKSVFCFSLVKNSYVLAEKPNGIVYEGYFSGTDRSVAAITLEVASDQQQKPLKIGVKTLKALTKYRVDRLGRLSPVNRETRTWHGAACT